MVNGADISLCYNDLYVELRKYFWPIDTVEHIAELEIECYKSFPSLKAVEEASRRLYQDIRETARKDKSLQGAYDALRDLVLTEEKIYAKLEKVTEVVQNENSEKF